MRMLSLNQEVCFICIKGCAFVFFLPEWIERACLCLIGWILWEQEMGILVCLWFLFLMCVCVCGHLEDKDKGMSHTFFKLLTFVTNNAFCPVVCVVLDRKKWLRNTYIWAYRNNLVGVYQVNSTQPYADSACGTSSSTTPCEWLKVRKQNVMQNDWPTGTNSINRP